MFICKCCGKEFEEWRSKDSIRKRPIPLFCSKKCSHSRIHTEETKNKIKNTLKKYYENNEPMIMNEESRRKWLEHFKSTIKERIMSKDFSTLNYESIKKRLFYEQEGKCNKCGITEWLGKPITLELEHKDGNHYNNERNNLELLCPNCHSQTPTFRGKNINGFGKRYSDEKMLEAFIKEMTIHKALKSLGLANKGRNYDRMKKILIQYGFDIKKDKGIWGV